MQRASAKIAQNLIQIAVRRREQFFARFRKFETELVKGDKGNYFVFFPV